MGNGKLTVASALFHIYEIHAIDANIREIAYSSQSVIRDTVSKDVGTIVLSTVVWDLSANMFSHVLTVDLRT